MIQEIINYTKYLKENSPMVFEEGLEPSKGLHIFLELDEEGNAINFPGERGDDWDYYDGKEMSPFLKNIIPYEQESKRVGTRMDKVLDTGKVEGSKKFQIFSCSPYILSFKKQSFDLIKSRLKPFFDNAINTCLKDDDETTMQKVIAFKNAISIFLNEIGNYKIRTNSTDLFTEDKSVFESMKNDFFVNIYYKNIPYSKYVIAHQTYLQQKLFNNNDFNNEKIITNETYGLSGFINGLNMKKPFLEHKTASMFKGIASRIQAKDTVYLNDFDLLLKRKNNKVFPRPLPIFIDKNEFSNSDEIISIFKKDDRLTYSQILKQLFKNTPDKVLQNYYLLFFNYKYELEDFDFVSKFRYSLNEDGNFPKIRNLFELKKSKDELKGDYPIKNIFHFEADIVKTIFNNSLVKVKGESFSISYFGEIKAEYVSGGEPVYQMILKYRKAFYDYIYKSKTQAINCTMWDEIMWNSVIGDLRNTNFDKKYYVEKSIKEKLNIWFSLYRYFTNNLNRIDMASKIPELLEKMKKVANDENAHFATTEEFAFGAGQIIYFLLNQSRASERTHALLEPFIQKVKAEQLQNSITQAINMYKHEISFGHGRFERLSAEVLAYETNDNLKDFQRLLLAGYFASPIIYEKKNNEDK
jgi:CRISPR-associated protein Csh1